MRIFERWIWLFRVDSIEALKERLNTMRQEFENDAKFNEIYAFAFFFGKEPTQKSIRK
jgi:hypothetical protein